MKKHNYQAVGCLLLALGVAGRALLAVPEAANAAEMSLTMLAVIGALVWGQGSFAAVLCGVGGLVLQLAQCGEWDTTTAFWHWALPVLRQLDLWLLLAMAALCLKTAAKLVGEEFPARARWMPVVSAVLLGVQTVAAFGAAAGVAVLGTVSAVLFVVFSVSLLWFTVLMLRAYNTLRAGAKKL